MKTRLHIVIDSSEKARLEAAARRSGLTLSAFVREAARERAEHAESKALDTVEELRSFFVECDAREAGVEPDWEAHLGVIDASKTSRAAQS